MKRLFIGGHMNGEIHEIVRDIPVMVTVEMIDEQAYGEPEGCRKSLNVYYHARDIYDPGDEFLGRAPSMQFFYVDERHLCKWETHVNNFREHRGVKITEGGVS